MTESHHLGRPRDQQIDGAILQAAAELIAEQGYHETTIVAICRRAGTTKPAFYRRFSGVAELIPLIIQSRHHIAAPDPDASTLDQLRHFQREQAAIFHDPFVRQGMAGWLSSATERPEETTPFAQHFLVDRYETLAGIIETARSRGEVHAGDPTTPHALCLIMDVLVSPMISRSLMPVTGVIDDELIEATSAIAYSLITDGVPHRQSA